ncbi:hypothetical protein GCM10023168_33200 [Fodinibacter luteus]|uniref:D-alanyl-D-alanine carboxypeptidase-like core domain-containing protein n=1 Tax=Fodinibacter luteus TaxID=552064 RepID=A0ABP8KPJ3_9MICO
MRPRPQHPARRGRHRAVRPALVVGLAIALVAGVAGAVVVWRPDATGAGAGAAAPTAGGPASAPPSAVATATPTATPTSTPTARESGSAPRVGRLTAADRHALSVAASRAAFPDGGPVPVAYLVADDALDLGWAAVPAAAARGGVVLLTRADGLPDTTAAELARLAPAEVVVVGDAGSVSDEVVEGAAEALRGGPGPRVTRVDHGEPAAAARAITRAAFPGATAAWVAGADRGADLATAAAAAAGRRSPLLVVDAGSAAPAADDVALLRGLGVEDVTVVGAAGDAAGTASGLARALPSGAVERVLDDDRAARAAAAHARAWPGATPAAALLATPDRPTDAFTGAFVAGRSGAPLLWALPYCLPLASRDAVLAPTVARVTVVGGERTLRSSVARLERCRSTEDPSSPWVLVNKRTGLSPERFAPTDLVVPPMPHANGQRLRADAATALAEMASAAADAGVGRVGIDTAFRSYETQESLYARTLARRGRAWTDRWYLRPGFSEHQTGLTVDLLPVGHPTCAINDCIDETPQGEWLARNSWRFGYLLRYEKGRTPVTGVGFEPWHFRFVGTALARAYHEGGWRSYEEFLGRPDAPTY